MSSNSCTRTLRLTSACSDGTASDMPTLRMRAKCFPGANLKDGCTLFGWSERWVVCVHDITTKVVPRLVVERARVPRLVVERARVPWGGFTCVCTTLVSQVTAYQWEKKLPSTPCSSW
jgi:hypothetical protein